MTIWTDKLDMSTIPDDVLYAEAGRRRSRQARPRERRQTADHARL